VSPAEPRGLTLLELHTIRDALPYASTAWNIANAAYMRREAWLRGPLEAPEEPVTVRVTLESAGRHLGGGVWEVTAGNGCDHVWFPCACDEARYEPEVRG
jgi:hypothetical protein